MRPCGVLYLFLGLLFARQTLADTIELPTFNRFPTDSPNGSFTYLATYPLTFPLGSTLNISWSTTFRAVDLCYYHLPDEIPLGIIIETNLSSRWYEWKLDGAGANLSNPFALQAVEYHDAGGKDTGGDFWTPMFYVRNMTTTESSSSRAFATSSAPPGQVPSPSTTPETEGPRKSKEETSSGSIVGFVVGITLAVIIIIGFIVVTLFKRLRRKKASKAKIAADCSTTKELVPGTQEYTPVPQEVYVRPAEMEGSRTCAELLAEGALPRVEELDVTSRERGGKINV